MDPTQDQLSSVLVFGGCGFVGYHIVGHFLDESSCTSVSVVSRNPRDNRLPGVSYYPGDIADLAAMRSIIAQIQPKVIIHAACPSAISASARTMEKVIVEGTRNLLTAAIEALSVRVFIFTSSATMAAGPEHLDLDENAPLADTSHKSHPYAYSKARADRMVLKANKPDEPGRSGLRTACIRLPIVYGERDFVAIPGALAALEKGQTHFQLGSGSNIWDFVSADNAAMAHMLLAKCLLAQGSKTPRVDGEAFNITDGERHRFWDFPRIIWKALGHEVKDENLWILPTWLALIIANVLEWFFWVFTLGTRRPKLFGRQQVEYSCFTHTYRIGKARERLGYNPKANFEEGLRKAVAWQLEEGGWRSRLAKPG